MKGCFVKFSKVFMSSIVAVYCYGFGSISGAQAGGTTVCPTGGACSVIPTPADSSYSGGYAIPGITSESIRPLIPNQGGPSGMYCGRAAVYTDSMAITDRVACDGHLVAYTAYSQAWMPGQPEWCSGEACYPATPGYYYTASSFATDCPSGYRITTTGSSGPYQYYSCIKS